ncbi:MAG: multidrug effflux MFS transporter [Pseudobdellovibrionaceae bacterium]
MTVSMPEARHTVGRTEFVFMMATLMSVVAFSIDAVLPALGLIGTDLHVTNVNHTQFILGFLFGGMAIGQLVNGPLSDAWGRRKILFINLGIYMVGSLICLVAQNIETMLIGRLVQGFGISGPYISVVSIVRDQFYGRHMAKIMSLVMMIFIMVPVFAPAIGQGVLLFFSWRAIFIMYLIYGTLVGLWVAFRLKETLPPDARVPYKISNLVRGVKTVYTNKTTLSYTLALGCVYGALQGNLNSIQQIFHDKYHVGSMFAVYFGLQALSIGISSFLNSQMVMRMGMHRLSLTASGMIVILSLLFLIISSFIGTPFALYFTYGFFLLLCFGFLFGNLNALAMEPMGHIAGLASAIIGATSSLIGITGGTIIGQHYEGSLTPVVLGFLILGSIAWVIIFSERTTAKEK